MWGYAKIMKIMSTKKYEYYMYLIKCLRKENAELKKQLIYQQTYIDTFKRKLDEVIFPNTDERGLGEQEIPVNFPDLW